MEIENTKNQIKSTVDREKTNPTKLEVSNGRLNSENTDAVKTPVVEVPNIRLAPEQIEEIHTDEYSLTLFYATRIEPMSIADIKREFPEPEPKKAQSVMERFVKVGLVHITQDGKYYSNFPDNYINYSHYRYDSDLEARKDAKVFSLMKQFTGNKEYWKDKTYFSMDAFYTSEQTAELIEMFRQIKLKAKQYANDNAKKNSTKGMKFRRMKFYDMNLPLVLICILCLGIMSTSRAFAGGNDPHGALTMFRPYSRESWEFLQKALMVGGGNDPTMRVVAMSSHQLADDSAIDLGSDEGPIQPGGGGHDPNDPFAKKPGCNGGHDPAGNDCACILEVEATLIPVQSPIICRLSVLIDFVSRCGQSEHPLCVEANRQIDELIKLIEQKGETK